MTEFKRISISAFFVLFAAVASAQDRTALVIANFDYGEHQLSHVKADAAAVSEALRREGFRVTVAENVPVKELKNTVEQFARSTVTRGVAVFYFAGLAGQYQTYNSKGAWWTHLQGAGKPGDPRRPDRESFALPDILKFFADHSTAGTNCVMLDAARPNPFLAERKNQPVGLAAVEAANLPDDMVVLLAAQPGVGQASSLSVAGRQAGSLSHDEPSRLASAVSKHLSQSRQSVGKMLEAVSKEVEQQSGGNQKPWFAAGRIGNASANDVAVRREPPGIGGIGRDHIPDGLRRSASWPPYGNRSFLDSQQPRDGERPGQEWINGHGMVFCWCPPGKFMMGAVGQASSLSVEGQAADRQAGSLSYEDAAPVEVTLSTGFWMGKYEVTLQEGQRAGWTPYRRFTNHKLAPMHNLAQGQTDKVISRLNDTERKAGRLPGGWEYALPTEAEWEYACRAGATTKYSFGDDAGQLYRFANYADKSLLADDGAMQFADSRFDDRVGKALAHVGSYQPNAWGLHDMHGNVAEWCADRYLSKLVGGTNPLVDQKKYKQATSDGVIRGGAWCSTAAYCEAGFRNSEFPGKERDFIGFRIVLRKK